MPEPSPIHDYCHKHRIYYIEQDGCEFCEWERVHRKDLEGGLTVPDYKRSRGMCPFARYYNHTFNEYCILQPKLGSIYCKHYDFIKCQIYLEEIQKN